MASIGISAGALPLLREMSKAAGISQREYIDLLVNYAYSIHRRPGSWEASEPFNVYTYMRPDTVADKWFDENA